jgi:hypothetical protein
VIYPTHFERDQREIYVEGEVFLDVRRNEKAPFIVRTKDFQVQVLGTSFNISSCSLAITFLPYYLQFINLCKSTKKYYLSIIYQVDNIYYVINPRYDSFSLAKYLIINL